MTGFFQTGAGKVVLGVVLAGALGYSAYHVYSMIGQSAAVNAVNTRWFVCSETMKAFQLDLRNVAEVPAMSPYSGKKTGYPAELCYWTSDGHVKKDPTPVLLNKHLGKTAPTFCPDCGRLVVERNPPAVEGGRVPPTQQEYAAKRGTRE